MIGIMKKQGNLAQNPLYYSGMVFLILLLFHQAAEPVQGQAGSLQYPNSSVLGDFVRLEQGEPNQSPRVSPEPKAIPKSSTTAKNSPKQLVRNAGPVVVIDAKTADHAQGSIKPVAGTTGDSSEKRSTRPTFDSDEESEVELKPMVTRKSGSPRNIAAPPKTEKETIAPPPLLANPVKSEGEPLDSIPPSSSPKDHFTNDSFASAPEIDSNSLKPVEDSEEEHDHQPHYQSATFLGVQPGTSTVDQVVEKLGVPQKTTKVGMRTAHLYSVDELNHIEILFENETVHSVEVSFTEPYPVDQVRELLAAELRKSRPVSFADERGDVIGLMFPEKGLTLIYTPSEEPGVPSAMVKKIAILAISADPFVIRAKGYLEDSPSDSKHDLKTAIYYDPENAESYWLLAQVELAAGDGASAMIHVQQALEFDPSMPQFHITLAKALMTMNRIEDAKMYLKEMLPLCEKYQHQKAVALCLLGDLYRQGAGVNCEQAYQYHKDALDIAISLREHSNPTVRSTAREVLVNAQLGVVKDIALGNWDNKWSAIEKWFASIKEILKDQEVVSKKRLIREYLFRVALTGLSAQSVISDSSSLEPYIQDVLIAAEELTNVSDDPINRRRIQWEAGCVLFEAVQSFQRKKQYSAALKYGEPTVDMIELGIEGRTSEADYYLLSRLYFRLGAIHAIGMNNHRAAIVWFDRTLPIFDDILPGLGPEETGRVGEMLVSMGVSYWHTDQKNESIRLSELGLKKIKAAVDKGYLEMTALLIPYSNLSTMWSKLDDHEKADKYYQSAAKIQQAIVENSSSVRK